MRSKTIVFFLLGFFLLQIGFAQADETERFLYHKNEYLSLKKDKPSLKRDTLIVNELDSMLYYRFRANSKYTRDINYISELRKYTHNNLWLKGKAIFDLWNGIFLSDAGEHLLGLKYINKAETTFGQIKDLNHQFYALYKLSVINSICLPQSDLGLKFAKKAEFLAHKTKNTYMRLNTLNALGNYYSSRGQHLNAIKAYTTYDSLKDPNVSNYFTNLANLGTTYLDIDSLELALKYFKRIEDNLPKTTHRLLYIYSSIYESLISYFSKKGNYKEARIYLEKAISHDYLGNPDRFKIYEYKILKAEKKYKEALLKLEEYRAYEQSFKEVENKNKIEGIKSQLNLNIQNEKLQNSEVQRLKSEQRRNNQLKWLLGIISLITLIFALYISYTNKKLKNKNEILISKNKEISEAMLKGQTIERKRVAADLHDNLGSTISSILFSVEAMNKSLFSKKELEINYKLKEMLEKAYNDIRLLSHNLLPEEFEKQGFLPALNSLIKKINVSKKLKIGLITSLTSEKIDQKIEFELYSIILELINNTIKHAAATKIHLSLEQNPSFLIMILEDNGRGMIESADYKGIGLKNIQARIDSLNAKWEIENPSSGGLKNTITIYL
jgi:signal transduction histidine kinase/tetratricopeptide (TPR) repeat protein